MEALFEVEVTTPFTVMVAPTPSYKSVSIPWDYIAEARRKGKGKMEEIGVVHGMTRTGKVYTLEHLGGTSKEVASKPPVVETGPDDLWRKVQAREYSIVDHLNKTPAQISILLLLQNSETHKNALMNELSETYVPTNITSGEMANMVGIIITYPDELVTMTCNETMQHKDSDSEDPEDDTIPEEIAREVENFENKPKSNLDETEEVNLGDSELNTGATNMRAMTTIFHDMIHKEIEVYVDDVIIKSKRSTDHIVDLRKFFNRLRRYNMKLNPTECAFRVPAGKLLGFIVSHRGIELDPSKVKAIQYLPPPKNKKDVMIFLGRLNYIRCFLAKSTVICEPIFKMLRKDAQTCWTEECQKAFDKIKEYLSKLPVLVPPELGRPLLLYVSMLNGAFGFVLGQHDEIGRKEMAIYYLSKKFTPYEARYSLLERTCCALTWISQKLRHYFCAYTTYLISRMDPLKYIFQKPMPTEVSFVGEDITEAYDGWRMFFDGAANFKGVEYEACILGLGLAIDMNVQELLVIGDSDLLVHQIEFKHVLRVQNEFADALATLSSMIQHPDKNFIDHVLIGIHKQPAYCAHVEEESDGNPWFHKIKEYLEKGEYPEHSIHTQKRTLRRLANHLFQSGGILYRRTHDLGLLWYVDANEASRLLEEIHVGTYGLHMNGFVLAKKILRAGYF
ncbi:uncharacterized protein [Nicotiana tomentosiformis]|uniref:uncharacterized protein n=1 Tax=Nicotiana tomentosiformis TaxID=4098 RepID=UPI00388C9419